MMFLAVLALVVPLASAYCDCPNGRFYQNCDKVGWLDDKVHYIRGSWGAGCQSCINRLKNEYGMNTDSLHCESNHWGVWIKGWLQKGRSVEVDLSAQPFTWRFYHTYYLVAGLCFVGLAGFLAFWKRKSSYTPIEEERPLMVAA